MGRKKFLLLLIIALLTTVLFTALNPQSIQLELAFVQLPVRLGVALMIATALGLTLGVLVRGLWVAELLRERGRLRRALKAAEAKARSLAAANQRAE